MAANRPPTAVPNPAALAALASEVIDRLRTVTLGFEEFRGTHQEEVLGAERLADRDEIAHHPEHPARTQRRRPIWTTFSESGNTVTAVRGPPTVVLNTPTAVSHPCNS